MGFIITHHNTFQTPELADIRLPRRYTSTASSHSAGPGYRDTASRCSRGGAGGPTRPAAAEPAPDAVSRWGPPRPSVGAPAPEAADGAKGGAADPAPKSKPLLCAVWACSDVRAVFGGCLVGGAWRAAGLVRRGRVGSRMALRSAGSGASDRARPRWRQPLGAWRGSGAGSGRRKRCGGCSRRPSNGGLRRSSVGRGYG